MERSLDWRKFVDRLVFCFGCGRFGLPRKGTALPGGWALLYQPHSEGPPGLHVCSDGCKSKVQAAISKGPVTEPLEMAANVMMDIEMRDVMMAEAMAHAMREEGVLDDVFAAALSQEKEND